MLLTPCRTLLDWLSLFDPPLLALAVLVCAGGSYTVFICLGRSLQAQGQRPVVWLGALCASFGASLWAAHFIAMLAYLPALRYSYTISGTLCSMLIATIGCAVPFGMFIRWPAGRFTASIAGLCFGLTIACTHFTGMNAMNSGGWQVTSPAFDLAGLAFATVFSGFALKAASMGQRRYNLILASLCLMLAVFGLYFLSMAGLSAGPFARQAAHATAIDHRLLASLVNTESLALAVAGISGVVLIAAFSAAMADRRIVALRAQEADKLRYQMRHDGTTGLPNRLWFHERLAEAINAPAARNFAILIVDLDRFRPVNDLYGRETGDRLLREAASRVQALIDPADMAARIGGDKFVILHHAGSAAAATGLAEQIIRSLEQPFSIDEHAIMVGASIGIAVYPPEGADAEMLLQDADTALQQARSQGGGRLCVFEADMRRRQEIRRQMEHDFRQAIADRQFAVHYQPLFESSTLLLTGFEALVRWEHPTHGLIGPADFIPFSEKSGLISRLGLWVLETACAEAALWPDHLRISINLSPVQLRGGDLAGAITAALQKTGLSAHRLELEVTESALIEDPEQARSILSRLKQMGVQITIDDFGTGYSSLSYLRRFAFDRIKIDRSFIENLEGDPDALAIVRAIINLGHSLRVSVVAEGIETPGQLQLLRRQGCDQLQGFLLGRPVPMANTGLMESHARAAMLGFSGTEMAHPAPSGAIAETSTLPIRV